MSDAIYHIIVMAVAGIAVVSGFRKGFTGQVTGVLGFAFGTVCAHVFEPQVEEMLRSLFPGIRTSIGAAFIYSMLSAALVYLAVYFLFRTLTKVLKSAMQVFYVGMLDSLMGSAFCLVKYMLLLSIFYNLILCVNPESRLLRYASADDGNVVEVVMLIAPGLLGCGSCEDLWHLIQLREAKKISCNIIGESDVITIEPAANDLSWRNGREIIILSHA